LLNPNSHERLRAPPKAGLRLNKIFFYIFDFARAYFLFSIKEEENFVSAFCAIAQAEAWCQCSARTARQEGVRGRNAAPSSLGLGRERLS